MYRPGVGYNYFGFRVCLVSGPAARQNSKKREGAEAERAPRNGGRGTRPESGEGSGVEVSDLGTASFPPRRTIEWRTLI